MSCVVPCVDGIEIMSAGRMVTGSHEPSCKCDCVFSGVTVCSVVLSEEDVRVVLLVVSLWMCSIVFLACVVVLMRIRFVGRVVITLLLVILFLMF